MALMLGSLLWGVRASDDGAAASLWAARACGGASSVEDVEVGGARYGCERPPLALNRKDALVTSKSA